MLGAGRSSAADAPTSLAMLRRNPKTCLDPRRAPSVKHWARYYAFLMRFYVDWRRGRFPEDLPVGELARFYPRHGSVGIDILTGQASARETVVDRLELWEDGEIMRTAYHLRPDGTTFGRPTSPPSPTASSSAPTRSTRCTSSGGPSGCGPRPRPPTSGWSPWASRARRDAGGVARGMLCPRRRGAPGEVR